MAASQVFQKKRGRDEYWKGGFDLPDAKRTNSELRSQVHDSDLMALLDKIDNMDNYEDTDALNEIEGEMRLNGVVKSLEDEIGSKAQTDNKIESTDQKGSSDQMGAIKHGELSPGGSNSEATSVYGIDHFTYYDDVSAELGFFADHISPDEIGIIINYIYGDAMANIMYSDGYSESLETTEVFYGSLWDDDICLLNEHSIIQNYFEAPQQTEDGLVVYGAEFHDVWNNIRPIQRMNDHHEAL